MHCVRGSTLLLFLPPRFPLPPSELEAANQRLTATDRESRTSSRPRASTAAAAAKELEDAQRAAATLRQQVQHQSEMIDRLRADARDRGGPRDRAAAVSAPSAAAAAAAAGVSEAVKAAEAAAEAAQDEADDLRDRLAEAERELQRMERRSATSAGRGGRLAAFDGGDGPGRAETDLARSDGAVGREKELQLERENRRLREENDKLSTELQAFDLEFFEEIEDLKYKYSEATKKLRQYED